MFTLNSEKKKEIDLKKHTEKRDNRLASLVHVFNDGRSIQCRPHPYSDEQNMTTAIERMNTNGDTQRLWFSSNNEPVYVSVQDLLDAIESGKSQAESIWADFFDDVQSL